MEKGNLRKGGGEAFLKKPYFDSSPFNMEVRQEFPKRESLV